MEFALEAHVAMPKDCYLVKTSEKYALDATGRQVWRHKSNSIPYVSWLLTWDGEKGEIEVFDKITLQHLGVLHSNGDFKSKAIRSRKLRLRT